MELNDGSMEILVCLCMTLTWFILFNQSENHYCDTFVFTLQYPEKMHLSFILTINLESSKLTPVVSSIQLSMKQTSSPEVEESSANRATSCR